MNALPNKNVLLPWAMYLVCDNNLITNSISWRLNIVFTWCYLCPGADRWQNGTDVIVDYNTADPLIRWDSYQNICDGEGIDYYAALTQHDSSDSAQTVRHSSHVIWVEISVWIGLHMVLFRHVFWLLLKHVFSLPQRHTKSLFLSGN